MTPDNAADSQQPAPPSDLPAEASLSPQEVHELRKLIEANPQPVLPQFESNDFIMPRLDITEADLDRFSTCLLEGEQYSETFSKYGGKLQLKLRVRSRKEEEMALAQINEDFKAGLIGSDAAYRVRVNLYNLVIQAVEIDGVAMVYDPSKTLKENAESGIFDSMSEPKQYILVGLLAQFEDKVSRMVRKALQPDFSSPAAGI